ncbi:MAG TPA: ATP-dependent DNA helicase UvrD2 [Acidimicrobiales bacterium]|nr:ATP-dependent DNA helicase UvrD2 [Acidimicrobiales bacterium]
MLRDDLIAATGRSVVVGPGAGAPGPWSGCERVRVTGVDRGAADELGAAWRERRPVVVELSPGIGLDDPSRPPEESVAGLEPWEWTVSLDLVGERLHHGVWANSLDARRTCDEPRSHWSAVARALGALVASDVSGADVTLADGTPAICDGGPLDASLGSRVGVAVLHRIGLEHGSLEQLGQPVLDGGGLAPDQLAAVTDPGAGARVIAPAGSGKTRVLTERASALVRAWGVPAAAIALVAFNVRAAHEMRDRLDSVVGARVRTLNALALRLCGDRSTIDETEVRRILGDLVTMPRRAEADPASPWIEALSRVRLGLATPADVEAGTSDVSDLDHVARAYRSELAARGAVDFDEQVVAAIERLLRDAAFRQRSQRYARILLVDEFQDLTPAHMLLVRLLCGPAGAVFAVGDDDQTIYGYSGATPRWLVDFAQWFPGARAHALTTNYRCPAPVVGAAANLLSRNALRVPKDIRAASTPTGGAPDALTILEPTGAPAARTATRVSELLDAGAAPAEIAVLARVNASLAPVQVLLRHRGLPVDGGVDDRFLRRGGVRAALAWLAVATAPGAALPGAVLRDAARRPKRAMSASLLDLVAKQRSVERLVDLSRWLDGKSSAREATKVRELADDVAAVRAAADRGSTSAVLAEVRYRVGDGGLEASTVALDSWSRGAIAAHGDDLDALVELAALEPDPERFAAWLSGQLAVPSDDGGVVLASVHAVKGREWPHVVLHHATDGILPHRLAEDVEEERRVFHVGITRCRSTLTIVPGVPASPFLAELSHAGSPASAEARRAPRAASTAATTPAVLGGRRAPARTDGRDDVAPLAATPGTRFTFRGHDHEVVATSGSAVRARVGGGPATTTIALGTSVVASGVPCVLAHPRHGEAFDRLRAWRSERSKALGKPAYVVFDDRTLRLVSLTLPVSAAGLLSISGIGQVKLDAYGDDLLEIAESLRGT